MLEYEVFKDIFDEKIFAKSKPDLLKKVAEHPDRYVGLFRPTKPEAKLLQNLLQASISRWRLSTDAASRISELVATEEIGHPLSRRGHGQRCLSG